MFTEVKDIHRVAVDHLVQFWRDDSPPPTAINEWVEILNDPDIAFVFVDDVQPVIDKIKHSCDKPVIEKLPGGGFSTSGASASKVCSASKVSHCVIPGHRREKHRVLVASRAEARDRFVDEGVEEFAMLTVTFPGSGELWRGSDVVRAVKSGKRRHRKLLRAITVSAASEVVMHRTKGHSRWSEWGHRHIVVALPEGHSEQTITHLAKRTFGTKARVEWTPIAHGEVATVVRYTLKSESANAWKDGNTWMNAATAIGIKARVLRGESFPDEVIKARDAMVEWFFTDGKVPTPYVPRRRAKKPGSTVHRASLDALYGAKREQSDNQRDQQDQVDTTTPLPTSTDTDDDLIPTATRRPRRPRRDIDDPLPPGYRRRSTLE